MKKTFIISLLLTATILIPCQGFPSDMVKIGFILSSLQEERYQRERAAFVAKTKALGAVPIFESCHKNQMEQISKFENMLNQGVMVIVLQPVDTEVAFILVRMANQRGVKVIGYSSLPMNGPIDLMVLEDMWTAGKMQCEAMLEWFKARKSGKIEGRVAFILGPPGSSDVTFLTESPLETVRAHKGLELVLQQTHTNWDPHEAMKTTNELLTKYKNNVDVFICNSDGLARGVISALKQRGLDDTRKVFVDGVEADLENIRYIVQGKQAVDVKYSLQKMAETAAEAAVKLARNPEKKITEIIKVDRMIYNGAMDVPTLVTPANLITRENIFESLIMNGVYTKEQIYGSEPRGGQDKEGR